MFGLGSARPRHCLKIGAQTLAWAEYSRTWRGRSRYRCVVSPTPAGSVKLSPIDLNLADQTVLEERLRSLAGPAKRLEIAGRVVMPELPRRMTLLLPDLAVRTTVVVLDHLPPHKHEIEALIRWKLGQEQRLPLAGSKLIWQVFPAFPSVQSFHIVLVVAVQDSILAQYESLCESAGLLPQEVGVTSCHAFNLWVKAAGGYKRLDRDLAWLTVMDGALTCFIFHNGRPVFVRTKLLAGDAHSAESADKVLRETAASLVACQEQHPHVQVKEAVLMTADDESLRLEQALGNELGIVVDRLAWDHVAALGWRHDGGTTSMAALPVVAAMV